MVVESSTLHDEGERVGTIMMTGLRIVVVVSFDEEMLSLQTSKAFQSTEAGGIMINVRLALRLLAPLDDKYNIRYSVR